MSYNPYTHKVKNLESEIAGYVLSLENLEADLVWFRGFDVRVAKELKESDDLKLKTGIDEAQDLRTKVEGSEGEIEALKNASKLGWKRSHWPLASERKRANQELKRWNTQLNELQSQLDTFESKNKETESHLTQICEELDRFDSFNEDILVGEISKLQNQINNSEKELSDFKDKEQRTDRLIERLVLRIESLDRKLENLRSSLSEAEAMESSLSRASNSYERRQIHEKCETAFDDGSPSKVIRNLEKRIKTAEKDKKKITDQIDRLIYEREGQDIQSVVIDGSNLCYDKDRFIGISALRQLCEKIPVDIKVEVVFDGSILKTLGIRDTRELYKMMPGLSIHLDDNPSGADEMILNAASNSTAYVLSGDRFGDFAEKPAVREKRVLRVQFINGTVQVPRMDISFEYA
ncbi:hypothetical protein [Corynebacterium flavescens]|uniref:hypothetical protein n=1 Tax=Corynebacterium flavescens TaxID=28028 RepID=UPI003FD12337